MTKKELIEVAKVCGNRNSCIGNKCPLRTHKYCRDDLIILLAQELEKSTLKIPVVKEVQENEK